MGMILCVENQATLGFAIQPFPGCGPCCTCYLATQPPGFTRGYADLTLSGLGVFGFFGRFTWVT